MIRCMQALAVVAMMLLSGCDKDEDGSNAIKFAICVDYPPFEYYKKGVLTGFDVELAELVAKKLGKKAVFKDMQFTSIFPALDNGSADAAISTLAATPDRKKKYDCSMTYFSEILALVYKKKIPITKESGIVGKKVGCQLGSTMEIWLKNHAIKSEIVAMDNCNQVIEALKAGHIDCALINDFQAKAFCKNNVDLTYNVIAKSSDDFAIVFKKGSSLLEEVNKALKELKSDGQLLKLEQKWVKQL